MEIAARIPYEIRKATPAVAGMAAIERAFRTLTSKRRTTTYNAS